MSLAADLLRLVEGVDARIQLPKIRGLHVAAELAHPEKSSKFGALVLDDGTVGLTYVALEDALNELQPHLERRTFVGRPPVEVARLYTGDAGWQRSLGMAAVNAISQHLLRRSTYPLAEGGATMALLHPEPGDHIGMVGYFPPLVEQVRSAGVPLTVIEMDPRWLAHEQGFEVTLDPSRLSTCNKVLCTGAVLVNHTLDAVLEHCRRATAVCVIGPTAGCLPDPLFARGVTALGGCRVTDSERFVELWSTQQRWRGATQRYVIRSGDYPGCDDLLASVAAPPA